MRYQLLTFVVTLFLVFVLSRVLLVVWQKQRVTQANGMGPVFLGGLRIDLNQIATYAVLPAFLMPWLEDRAWFLTATGIWFGAWWLGCVFMEICTPQFIDEYDTRPNRLFVEYLKHPKEVSGMLWRGYKKVLAIGLLVFAGMIALAVHLFSGWSVAPLGPWWLRPLESLLYAAVGFLMIRGTLKKRPINPSTVAFAGDGMVNSLALNSMYSLQYAIYAMKYEMSAEDVYGKMPAAQMNQIVCEAAGLEQNAADGGQATMHLQTVSAAPAKPLNIVLIVEESLGAQYVQTLGGRALTPCLDALYEEGWGFTRAYATGTRSVRGLEALSAGFPPTITQSVFKLPGAQSGFFTIADVLAQQHGYHSRFLYGGACARSSTASRPLHGAHADRVGTFSARGFSSV